MPKINPRLPVHDGQLFSWSGKTGYIEASELARVGCSADRIAGRVYGDASDCGFLVRSHRTGRTMLFVETSSVRDGDGDVVAFRYTGEDGIAIEVFND